MMHVYGERFVAFCREDTELDGGREQHPSWVLQVLLDPHKERHGFPAVQQSMIVRKSYTALD